MKIIKFIGGLGNQMFQYAFLLSHKYYHPEQVYLLDESSYRSERMHNGFELTRIFSIPERVASGEELKPYSAHIKKGLLYRLRLKTLGTMKGVFFEKDSSSYYPNALQAEADYYEGYWQCHKYFDIVQDQVKNAFKFRGALDHQNMVVLENIQNNPYSVSIHVRRGDYLQHELYRGLCEIDYYLRAFDKLKSLLNWSICDFYIFSNDIEWCKSHLGGYLPESRIHYISNNTGDNSYKDMILMSACRYNIIANSSFSWWAAYLNANEKSIVIAPMQWINRKFDYKIQMEQWILV